MTPQPAKPRVLVVDDHSANRMAFQSILEDDYTVYLAESGAEALKLVLLEEFAVILLDVRMPEMDGFETAKLLRQREKTRHTPIIFMSAHEKNLMAVNRGFISGATDYVFSPVDPDFLKFKVRAYVAFITRSESLKTQVQELSRIVECLRAQLRESQPDRLELLAKIRRLESALATLQEHVVGIPS